MLQESSKKSLRRFQQVKISLLRFPLYFPVPMKTRGISRRKFLGAAGAAATFTVLPLPVRAAAGESATAEAGAMVSTVRISSLTKPILFDPDQALGSSMDILSHDVVEKIYTPEMVKQCLSAGWAPIISRQNTELSMGGGHWNPDGTGGDAANRRGYFTGNTDLKQPIRHSYGYPLPHRGHTRNGGAERGYSRLTDGNPE